MHFDAVTIHSFRSFWQAPRIKFARGCTVIIGKNDAGKTALLDALTLDDLKEPHRSTETVPSPYTEPPPASLSWTVTGAGTDVARFFATCTRPFRIACDAGDQTNGERQLQLILDAPLIKLAKESGVWTGPYLGLNLGPAESWATFQAPMEGGVPTYGATSGQAHDLRDLLKQDFCEQTLFRFQAQRLQRASVTIDGEQPRLKSDASNLPAVLHSLLSRDRARFAELCAAVRRILPHIANVQTPVGKGPSCQVVVWHDGMQSRQDLGVPLEKCGTGVGQILSIVTALFTADLPRTFLIEEPNSFLHPSAVSALMELLREHSQHQYVITTHSPDVISAAEPQCVIHLELIEGKTRATQVDPTALEHQRRILCDVGVQLSSVFAADRILWVEGLTEELCFPEIVRHFRPHALRGCRIVGVADTGSFHARTLEQSVRVYDRLVKGVAIIPVATGFFFDREGLRREEVDKRRQRMPRLFYTFRRMTESYLLFPEAIAQVLSEDLEQPVELERVEDWLVQNALAKRFEADCDRAVEPARWAEQVHASELLEELFNDLSDTRVAFKKPSVPVRLARWTLSNAPELLTPLSDEVIAALVPPAADG